MRSQDLSLLYVFDAIMTEGSITRAAERLTMTQPAVSNAVARMRDTWKDPVFVKTGRRIEPTAFALNLWSQVRDPIHQLSSAVDSSSFNAMESHRKFRIAIGDAGVDMFWLSLLDMLSQEAPNVDVYAFPFMIGKTDELLREAQVDIAIGPITQQDRSLRTIELYDSHFILAMGKHHPLARKDEISLDEFLDAKHLLMTATGNAEGVIDKALSQNGMRRRIAATVNHFSAIPKVLSNSDLIAVIPHFVAGNTQFKSDLWLTKTPIEIEPVSTRLAWHVRHDRDPGITWIREQLVEIAKKQWQACTHCVESKVLLGDYRETA